MFVVFVETTFVNKEPSPLNLVAYKVPLVAPVVDESKYKSRLIPGSTDPTEVPKTATFENNG